VSGQPQLGAGGRWRPTSSGQADAASAPLGVGARRSLQGALGEQVIFFYGTESVIG